MSLKGGVKASLRPFVPSGVKNSPKVNTLEEWWMLEGLCKNHLQQYLEIIFLKIGSSDTDAKSNIQERTLIASLPKIS